MLVQLEAEEYARKGVTLTPELWLVKLMVGAIDSSCTPAHSCPPPPVRRHRHRRGGLF